MNRRAFLKWLGIGVPAIAVVAVVAPKIAESTPEWAKGWKVTDLVTKSPYTEARLGEWNNYYSEGDPELMKAIEQWKPNHEYNVGDNIYYDKEFMKSFKIERLDQFNKLASGKNVPIYMDVKRNFFVYNTKS